MSIHKSTTPSFPKPGLSGKSAHHDSTPRRKPAVTPRREWQSVMRQLPAALWLPASAASFEPGSNSAVIQ